MMKSLQPQKAEAEKNGEEYPEDMVTFTAEYKDVLNKEVFDYLSEHRLSLIHISEPTRPY